MILVIIILYIIYFWYINVFSATAIIDITKNVGETCPTIMMPDRNWTRSWTEH